MKSNSGSSIGQRMLLVLGSVLALSLCGSAFGLWSLHRVSVETESMMNNALATERLASDWSRTLAAGVRRTTAIALSSDATLAEYFAPDAAESTRLSTQYQKALEPLMDTPNEKAIYEEIGVQRKAYLLARDAIAEAKKAGDAATARKIFDEKFVGPAAAYQAAQAKLVEAQRLDIDATAARVAQLNKQARLMLIVLSLCAVALGVVLTLWLRRSITRPLQQAVEVADRIARFDLSQNIAASERDDETGKLLASLTTMQNALRSLVTDVRNSTESITTGSTEIAVGNQDLSRRTEQTSSNLQQAASSMEQLTGTVKQSADSARQANQLAASAAEVAARGGNVVSQVVTTMDEINASSKKISDIIGVIDGIAFQTNILALNAAVEAARAGEQGRGFAVVASEVRSLAGRSAEAAKEIKGLIGASVDKVEAGSRLVADAGATMTEIVSSVQRVSDIIGEITAASSEQSDGIGQVNTAVIQLDQMTQQNAALVEESAAASESLKEQASRLAQVVSTFQLHR